ncbi:carbohydrate ABC transporter membrane protein 2, CUT1 family [Alkalispirochaeta americana]|uniref:Carbohydrate ABC transporter membrane protein 2, CUT1 family n=1 Tax=Alkalispirochaeta americana TaxID=159291 RepID=A0A1N6N6H9_9SPIO|nr:carbohydrate ABC transporter permease [Alkalispirochaeta americana]SIP87643.1 carbohydrate ABC transporter membrane protein 2, CUT1 family [Alkalispirochaeta americana]
MGNRINRQKGDVARKVIYGIVVLGGGILMALPFIWMTLSSLKTEAELMMTPPSFFPRNPVTENYALVMRDLPFLLFYRNTIMVTVLRSVSQILCCSMAAFAFAKIRFPGRNMIFLGLLAVLMVPHQMILVPNYIIMRFLGLSNTLLAVALPGMFSAFGMFLLRQFYLTLPDEFLDSGKIDGCTHFGIFAKLYFPLTQTAVMALLIFTVMYSWNDFIWPLIISSSDRTRVLSVGIALLQGQSRIFYNQIMAGAVMATLPVIALFVSLQRYFVQGIALTGVKG